MEKPVKPLGKRRQSREFAAQCLYQHDLNGGTLEEVLVEFWQTQGEANEQTRAFAEELVRGTLEHRDAIDERIKKYTEHWELQRIAAVDRNILRLPH